MLESGFKPRPQGLQSPHTFLSTTWPGPHLGDQPAGCLIHGAFCGSPTGIRRPTCFKSPAPFSAPVVSFESTKTFKNSIIRPHLRPHLRSFELASQGGRVQPKWLRCLKAFRAILMYSLSWEPLPCFFFTLGTPKQRQQLMGKHQALKIEPQVLMFTQSLKKRGGCWYEVVSGA